MTTGGVIIAYNLQKLAKTCKENTDVLSTFSGLYTQFGAPKPYFKKCTYLGTFYM